MTNSKAKGKRGELEWAKVLRELGYGDARRGQQYDGRGQADVIGGIPGTHCEAKRRETLSLYPAMEQAVRDAKPGEIPYVACVKNRKPWLVVVRAGDLRAFARAVLADELGDRP